MNCLENTLNIKILSICLKIWTAQKTKKRNKIQVNLIKSALTILKTKSKTCLKLRLNLNNLMK